MTRWHLIVLLVFLTVIMLQAPAVGNFKAIDDNIELEIQYKTILRDIANRRRISKYAEQVYRADAMIDKADRDPLDVVVRRTSALLDDLRSSSFAPDLAQMAARLKELQKARAEVKVTYTKQRFELFKKACMLRRRIALSNPLLDFDKILFIKRHRATFNHMCDQYYGINILPGGGIYVLSDPFSDNPQVRDVLADSVVQRGRLKGQRLEGGSVLSPDLSYDGKTIVFAYVECKGDVDHRYHTDPSRGHWNKQRCYHIFKVNVDGSGLEQLTDGTWNDFDPCWLPNGRLTFISERRGGYLRCGRVCPTYTLHDMNADGSDIRCLSLHETNEWHPSVTNDGRIIYTRWDYVDRHGCTAHLPWITTPDGRDSRAVHGNFAPRELRADMELDVRAIPGSHKFVATGAPHHGQAFGSLLIFDPHVEDDDIMAPVKRLTPEVDFPETQGGAQVYGTPWPLSEKYYLCVYEPMITPGTGQQGKKHIAFNYGIYLLDIFGNKELIYRDPEIACLSPMPLRPRLKPPIMPDESVRVAEGQPAEATLALVNVYDTLTPWSEDIKIKSLRVYQILPAMCWAQCRWKKTVAHISQYRQGRNYFSRLWMTTVWRFNQCVQQLICSRERHLSARVVMSPDIAHRKRPGIFPRRCAESLQSSRAMSMVRTLSAIHGWSSLFSINIASSAMQTLRTKHLGWIEKSSPRADRNGTRLITALRRSMVSGNTAAAIGPYQVSSAPVSLNCTSCCRMDTTMSNFPKRKCIALLSGWIRAQYSMEFTRKREESLSLRARLSIRLLSKLAESSS